MGPARWPSPFQDSPEPCGGGSSSSCCRGDAWTPPHPWGQAGVPVCQQMAAWGSLWELRPGRGWTGVTPQWMSLSLSRLGLLRTSAKCKVQKHRVTIFPPVKGECKLGIRGIIVSAVNKHREPRPPPTSWSVHFSEFFLGQLQRSVNLLKQDSGQAHSSGVCPPGPGSISETRPPRDLGASHPGNATSSKGRGCICGVTHRIWAGTLMPGRGSRGHRTRGSSAWGRGRGLVGRGEVRSCLHTLCFSNGWKTVGCLIPLEPGSPFVH